MTLEEINEAIGEAVRWQSRAIERIHELELQNLELRSRIQELEARARG